MDWRYIAKNALWVLGLALCVATYSYREYLATQPPSEASARNQAKQIYRFGLGLVCFGLGLTSKLLLAKILWGIVVLLITFWPNSKETLRPKAPGPTVYQPFPKPRLVNLAGCKLILTTPAVGFEVWGVLASAQIHPQRIDQASKPELRKKNEEEAK